MKDKKCKQCGAVYAPARPLQSVCSPLCAIAYTVASKAKTNRSYATLRKRELQAGREQLKTRSDYLKETQSAFNRFIRARDRNEGCISCGRRSGCQFHAGHYRSVGSSPELRFNEWNVSKQCATCNNHLSGNAINYRAGLIVRIGVEKVEWLEVKHEAGKWSIEELKDMKKHYNRLALQLEKQLERDGDGL